MEEGDSLVDANDGGDAVLAGHNGAVGHHAADLHDQAAGGEEEGRPGRVGAGADEDVSRGKAGLAGIKDNTDAAFDRAG